MLNKSQTIIRWAAGAIAGVAIISTAVAVIVAQTDPRPAPAPERVRPRRPGLARVGGPGRFFGGGFGLRVPGMTDAQREQAQAVFERHEAEIRPLVEQLRAARLALADASNASPVDEALIRQRSAEVAALEAEVAVIRAHVRAEILALLTPEQQQQLQERRSRIRERLKDRPRQWRNALP